MDAFTLRENQTSIPTIHVISDSVGATAQAIARAAASQFGEADPNIELLSNVRNFQMVEKFLLEQLETHEMVFGDPRIVVFYTIIDDDIKTRLHKFLVDHPTIYAVDLLTKAVDAIAQVSGMVPMDVPGEQHIVNERYFHRIEAMEWTIAHDDGRNPQDLPKSEIVLLGVSRCGKTPTSIYLAQEGYRVSNVPLDPQSTPPKEIFQVDSTRLFGLMTTVEVLRPFVSAVWAMLWEWPPTTPIPKKSRRTWRNRAPSCASSAALWCTPRTELLKKRLSRSCVIMKWLTHERPATVVVDKSLRKDFEHSRE